MTGIDCSILVAATNLACPLHRRAHAFLEMAVRNPRNWIIPDQVLFEYYRVVRNPLLFEKPLSPEKAARHLRFFREEVGWRHCSADTDCWRDAITLLARPGFDARRTFDLLLAVSLHRNGAQGVCTHTPASFAGFGWLQVVDPLA